MVGRLEGCVLKAQNGPFHVKWPFHQAKRPFGRFKVVWPLSRVVPFVDLVHTFSAHLLTLCKFISLHFTWTTGPFSLPSFPKP